MELDQVLKERSNVRKFKKIDISWDLVSECLNAATCASNSGNVQNWRFIVVRSKENREKLLKLCEEQYWAINAPVLIVVCSELDKIKKLFGVRGEALYAIQNCAAGIENLLLKAYDLGLGSSWIGAFDEVGIRSLMKIPDDARPQAIIALGYGQDYEKKPTREPLENVVFFEKYGERADKERGKILPIAETLKKKINNFKKAIR